MRNYASAVALVFLVAGSSVNAGKPPVVSPTPPPPVYQAPVYQTPPNQGPVVSGAPAPAPTPVPAPQPVWQGQNGQNPGQPAPPIKKASPYEKFMADLAVNYGKSLAQGHRRFVEAGTDQVQRQQVGDTYKQMLAGSAQPIGIIQGYVGRNPTQVGQYMVQAIDQSQLPSYKKDELKAYIGNKTPYLVCSDVQSMAQTQLQLVQYGVQNGYAPVLDERYCGACSMYAAVAACYAEDSDAVVQNLMAAKNCGY
jgi:hypothetical protein